MTRRLAVGAGVAVWLVAGTAEVAWADNCGTITDCFPSGRSVLLALAAILIVIGLVAFAAGGGALLAGLFGGGSLALASGGVAASAGAVSISAAAAGQVAVGGAAAITSGVLLAAAAESGSGGGEPPSGRPRYEPSPKHGPAQRGDVAAAPRNGQAALDRSVQVKPTSARRVGVDAANQELVVFDETYPGQQVFHGHVRLWNQLRPEMQAALRRAGLVDARGRIIVP